MLAASKGNAGREEPDEQPSRVIAKYGKMWRHLNGTLMRSRGTLDSCLYKPRRQTLPRQLVEKQTAEVVSMFACGACFFLSGCG